MVSRELVDKVISSVLVKCGYNVIPSNSSSWGVRFPRKVRERLDAFARRFCTYGMHSEIEWQDVIDKNGEVVYEESGEESELSWSRSKVSELVRDFGYSFHCVHNHPHGYFGIPTCFSRADINSFLSTSVFDDSVYLFKSTTVETPNGSRMSIMMNSKFGVSDEEKLWSAYDKLHDEYFAYGRELIEARKSIINDVVSGEVDVPLLFLDGEHNSELSRFTLDLAIQRVGSFEDRCGGVRALFNDANCELSIEWRRDNNPYVKG